MERIVYPIKYKIASRLKPLAMTVMASLLFLSGEASAITDTYEQTFDSMTDGTTINGADSWSVTAGGSDNAMIESGTTSTGSGKALKIVDSQTPVEVGRTAAYGGVTPTWIEYVVKPGMGAEQTAVPSTGIAAVQFSSTGKIMVSDSNQWVDTGKTFSTNLWYRVMLKLNFSTHTYDMYCEPVGTPKTPFVADKQDLDFIDPNLSTLSRVGFKGTYKQTSPVDSLADDVLVHFVDKLQFINAPHSSVKGFPTGLITVQLQNANSEPQTAWKDITLELRTSTQTGQFSLDKTNWVPITSVTIPEGAQQASFFYMDTTEGKVSIGANEFPDRGWTNATQEEKVVSEGDYFKVTVDATQVAGEPFPITITANDGSGNPDTSYAGRVEVFPQYISPNGGTKQLTPDTVTDFANGTKDATLTYPDAGTIKLAVRDLDSPEKIGYSGDVVFLPHSFSVSAGSSVLTVGKNFTISVQALNKTGAVTPNYTGPAQVEIVPVNPASTTGALNPSQLPEGAFQNGVATLQSAYNRWGTANLKAFDINHPEKMGVTATPLQFAPKSLSVVVQEPQSSRTFFYVAENMQLKISVLDNDGLPIENYEGTVSISPTPQFGIQSQYTFSAADKGQKTFIVPAGAAGKYRLKVEDTQNSLSVESGEFEVRDATIVVSSSSAPVGTTVVEIQLVDASGKRITEESEMTVTILFQEENENGTVFITDITKPLTFKRGLAKLVVADSEAETVSFSARSKYGLKVINGKITFGRAGATGVGTLMLRETKE